ncbi:MAG: TraB/GumN family protein [Halobacteriaceae archaeon]
MSDGAADSGTGSVTVVGTAHVSADSAAEVREVIDRERPDVVAVELDEGRHRQMQGDAPEDIEPSDLLKGSIAVQILAYWLLSYVQARLGERFDIEPGADMRAALEAAEEIGAEVALVDRDIQVTIQRFWARLSVVEKLQLVGGLALGATGLPIAGLTGGVVLGVIAGPIAGLASGAIGLGTTPFLGVVGGTAVALLGTYLLLEVQTDGRLAAAVGVTTGAVAGPILGLTDPVVGSVLGGLALRLVGGLIAGVVIGAALGLGVGAVLGALTGSSVERMEEVDIDELTDTDVVSAMISEFRKFSPGGAEALIDERDAYIAHELVALRDAGADVVAVVGAGHQAGVESYLERPTDLPPRETLVGRESGGIPVARIAGALFSLSFVALFGLLVMADIGTGVLLRVVAAWVLYNGLFALGLAKVAGARWDSAGVGGAVAWLTSLNPLLAPGWFAGYVELHHRSVRISDIGRMNELLTDEDRPLGDLVRELFDVPLFRLVAVVSMTNIGSLIASLSFPVVVLPLLGGPFDSVDEVTAALSTGLANTIDLLLSLGVG